MFDVLAKTFMISSRMDAFADPSAKEPATGLRNRFGFKADASSKTQKEANEEPKR